jgi:hypothetical protein
MNILYIGPYRINHSIGYESLNILLDISSDTSSTTVSRPIFAIENKQSELSNINNILFTLENKLLQKTDLLVQHLDIDSMQYNSKFSKHIFIPIIHKTNIPTNTQKEKFKFLSTKGLFLYKNNIEKSILDSIHIHNKESIDIEIDDNLAYKSKDFFNLGIYNIYKKYYSIVEAAADRENIENLIINFIQCFHKENNCLILFVQNMDKSNNDHYVSFIKNIYNNLNISYNINKIILIPIELNIKNIGIIHNTGNIYIDINQDINRCYAIKYKKPIIENSSDIKITYTGTRLNNISKLYHTDQIDLLSDRYISSYNTSIKKIINNYV